MDIFTYLNTHGIQHTAYDHPPVFTVEDATRLKAHVPGARTKNVFLRDRKGRRHFLVMVGHDKTVDTKALAKQIDVNRLNMGTPERLQEFLGVKPGSVTILGLIHDVDHNVEVYIDTTLWQAKAIQCHPLINTQTLVIEKSELEKFLDTTQHEAQILDIPALTETNA